MNNGYIIKNAYLYYDKMFEYNIKHYDIDKIFTVKEINKMNDLNNSKLSLKDINNKNLFEADYQVISFIFDHPTKSNNYIWIWSWSYADIVKNKTFLCRKILKYGLDINIDNKVIEIDIFLKSLLVTSRLQVNEHELELLKAISLYITKQKGYLVINSNLSKQYCILSNITKNE